MAFDELLFEVNRLSNALAERGKEIKALKEENRTVNSVIDLLIL